MESNLTSVRYWVLHSPYPDKTWRGIEKVVTTTEGEHYGSPLLFESRESAIKFLKDRRLEFFEIVEVCLIVPSVRKSLQSVGGFE